jgi:hypothetical protein
MHGKKLLNSLASNYFKTSTKIFRLGLDSSTLLVFCFLSSCKEDFHPSVRFIADNTKLSKNTVTKAMRALVAANVIRLVEASSKGHTSEYTFVDPKDWGTDVP